VAQKYVATIRFGSTGGAAIDGMTSASLTEFQGKTAIEVGEGAGSGSQPISVTFESTQDLAAGLLQPDITDLDNQALARGILPPFRVGEPEFALQPGFKATIRHFTGALIIRLEI
jgi:hypothetical protein